MVKSQNLTSIQYLRGLAALGVVAMHTGWTRTGLGSSGVDMFFIISGFIMVHVSQRDVTPGAFLRARILRVVPLYWLVTLAAVAVRQDSDVPRFLTSLMFWPHMGFDGRDYPVVIQGWTLNFEVFFYVVFAVTLTLTPRRRIIGLTVLLASLCAIGAVSHPEYLAAATYTNSLLLEFLFGVWICQAWRKGWLPKGRAAWSLVVVGLIAMAAQFHTGPQGDWRAVVWGMPIAAIVAGALGVEASGNLPRIPGLRVLGDASYALYLTHLLVLDQVLPELRSLPTVLALPLALLPCVALAVLLHRVVERPLHRWMTRSLLPRASAELARQRPS